jgi:hypothetical protein
MKPLKKFLVMLLAVLLLASMVGCKKPEPETIPVEQPPTSEVTEQSNGADVASLTSELQSKYANQANYEYAEPLRNQKRDVYFEFESSIKPDEFGIDATGNYKEFKKLVDVFVDSSFTKSADPVIKYSEENGSYIVNPPVFAAF